MKHRIESLECRRLLAAVSWDAGGDGVNWTDPLNWSNDVLPTSVDDVTIETYGVVLNGSAVVSSLYTWELVVNGGTLELLEDSYTYNCFYFNGASLRFHNDLWYAGAMLFGQLNDSTTERLVPVGLDASITGSGYGHLGFVDGSILDLTETESLLLNDGARLYEPTIEAPSPRTIRGGALSGATINIPLSLMFVSVGGDYILNAPLTLEWGGHVGSATGSDEPWRLIGNQTVTFNDGTGFYTWGSSSVTFECDVTVNFLGSAGFGHDNNAIVTNKGTMNVSGAGKTVSMSSMENSFVNQGTINVFNDARLLTPNLQNYSTGVINVDHARLEIFNQDFGHYPTYWSNGGAIVANQSSLTFDGVYEMDDFGSITMNGGSVTYKGRIENEGEVFEALAGADHWYLNLSVIGGTIETPTSNGVFEILPQGWVAFFYDVQLNASIIAGDNSGVGVYDTLTLFDDASITFASNTNGAAATLQFGDGGAQITGWGKIEATGNLALDVFLNSNAVPVGIGPDVDLVINDKSRIRGDDGAVFINDGRLVVRGATDLINSTLLVDVSFHNHGLLMLQPGAGVQFDKLTGDVNRLQMAGDKTRLKLNGAYNFNQLTKIGEGSVLFLVDGSWTRSATMEVEGTVIFDHDDDADTTFNAIKSAVISGYANNTWTGEGLRDPLAAADARLTLGYAKSSAILGPTGGTFRGFEVDGSATIVHHTLDADFNLDNTVNFNDVLKIAQNYNSSSKNFTDGDVNFDGDVDFDDLLRTSQLYGQSAWSIQSLERKKSKTNLHSVIGND